MVDIEKLEADFRDEYKFAREAIHGPHYDKSKQPDGLKYIEQSINQLNVAMNNIGL